MASFVYNTALSEIFKALLDLDGATIKMALVTSVYSADKDDTIADAGTGSDMGSGELSVTGYVGGYGGAGRQTLANVAITIDSVLNTITFNNTLDITWVNLSAGQSIIAAVLLIEDFLGSTGNDTETRLLSYNQLVTPIATDGGNILISFPSGLIVGST